jgi:Fe-S-cluster containining protein
MVRQSFDATTIAAIADQCRADLSLLTQLQTEVARRLGGKRLFGTPDDIDEIDLLLGVFYQQQRPCPLLDSEGSCSIYALRPLTCRMYLSFSPPALCAPEHINEQAMTYLLSVNDDANRLLDALHERFIRNNGDTGLRSALIAALDTKELSYPT